MRLCAVMGSQGFQAPAFRITITIIGTRIRMSALTYAKKINSANHAHIAKNKNLKRVLVSNEDDLLKSKA